jgi:5-methylcytosine-specific restriction endonuclease McrA
MKTDILLSLRRLSDADLVAGVKSLVAREKDATAQIVAHLAELDTRDVHLREGYPSLFVYCRDALGLSEWEAYNRIEVARASRRFPEILDRLADGSIHFTAARLLAPHLTASNHRDVLESARGKRKVEVQEIVARLAPRPDVRTSIRRLPTAVPGLAPAITTVIEPAASAPTAPGPAMPAGMAGPLIPSVDIATPSVSRPPVVPLSPGRYKLQLTIGGETLDKLRRAKDLLGHVLPSGDDAAVIDRALDVLLSELARTKLACTARPRPSRGRKAGARSPAAAVKRAVWQRDLRCCAYVGTNGHRCQERRFLEFHHVDPHALGGEASVDQIALRCRRHNDYEGRLYFGTRRSKADTRVADPSASERAGESRGPNLFRNKSGM